MASQTITVIPETYIKHMRSLISHLTIEHIHRLYLLWAFNTFMPLIRVQILDSLELCAFMLVNSEHRRMFAKLMLTDPYLRPTSCPIEDVVKMTTE